MRDHLEYLGSARFSPDGTRIVTASGDGAARIWNADGSGEAVVLRGHRGPLISLSLSRDGSRIVTASRDKTMRLWNTPQPISLSDPRLWQATTYCMPIGRRQALLGVSKEMARTNLEKCRQRVRQSRRAGNDTP